MAIAGWGSFFGTIAGPVAKKVMTALGLGTLTIVGLQTTLDMALSAAKTHLTGVQPVVIDLVAMAGLFDMVSILAGGLTGAVAVITLKRMSVLT